LSGLSELASLANVSTGSAFVLDQIDVLKSRRIFRKVVEQNRLNISYSIKGNVKNSEMLESHSPVKMVILDLSNQKLDSLSLDFILKKKGSSLTLEDKKSGNRSYSLGQRIH